MHHLDSLDRVLADKAQPSTIGGTIQFHNDKFASPQGLVQFVQGQNGLAKIRDNKIVVRRDWKKDADKIKGAMIDGQAPTFDAIADGAYPVSRPLYFYVKKAHVGAVPGIPEYLAEFTSEKAIGDEGYLTEKGLIPEPEAERKRFRYDAEALTPMGAL